MSSSSNAEQSRTDQIQSFNTDGFTLGIDGAGYTNVGGNTYVAWQWKANGGTTASNTDGNITTTVQANPTAGFSIITYTGNGVQTGKTVGHGLGAVPKMIISKERASLSNVPTWRVYHEGIGATKYLQMPQTDAESPFTDWDNTTPTSSVYSVGGTGGYTPTNSNTRTYVAYVFADVQGYSKFGKYVGNGNVDGPFVYTGFQPAWILLKRSDSSSGGNWHIIDNKRSASGGANVNVYSIAANTTDAESTGEAASTYGVDFLSNGFKIRASHVTRNASGGSYIYMAFAENPFTTSTGVPTTAR